jgi:hypothetical protein
MLRFIFKLFLATLHQLSGGRSSGPSYVIVFLFFDGPRELERDGWLAGRQAGSSKEKDGRAGKVRN